MLYSSLKHDLKNKNSEGKYPLFVRIRSSLNKGKRVESSIKTGIEILPKYFSNGGLSPRTPNYTVYQRIINSIFDDINRIISELKERGFEPNPSLVKKQYEDNIRMKLEMTPITKSFWSSFDEFCELKKSKTLGYNKSLNTFKNRLIEFEVFSKKSITYDYVVGNPIRFQSEFQNFLWEEKKLSNGYVNKFFKILSNFLFYSVQQGYITKKPSFKVNDTVERDEKIYLYKKEVFKLYKSSKWDFEIDRDFSNNPHIVIIEEELKGTKKSEFGNFLMVTNWELVKDIFLFMCSIGCRYSDIPYFKVRHFSFEKDSPVFTWVQQKTQKKVSVPVNEVSGNIFKKYSKGKSLSQNLFPPLSNQKFNKQIKLLFKDLNFNRLVSYPKKIGSTIVNDSDKFLWELISSHSGRRTFIKNLIDIGTMDYSTIMKLSGHKTLSEFQKYISVSKHDLLKGKSLYQMDKPKNGNEVEELTDLYSKLDDEKKKILLQLVRNF